MRRVSSKRFVRDAGTTSLALVVAALALVTPRMSQAATLTVLHDFTGQADGAHPLAGLSEDIAGNFYGTTSGFGQGYGTVFKLKPSGSGWIMVPLYSFAGGADGFDPRARVVVGPDGALYGTTFEGGINDGGCVSWCGTVFKLTPPATPCGSISCPWTHTVLYRFHGPFDGGQPTGDLAFDGAGNIYGATSSGGYPPTHCEGFGCGVVYKLTRSGNDWTESVLHYFDDGTGGPGLEHSPVGGVIFDDAGNLYGATYGYGSDGYGAVFELTPSLSGWTESVIYVFRGGTDGRFPYAGLTFDHSGNFYGSTGAGGSGGGGTVFELMGSSGNWTFNLLCSLTGNGGPKANLTLDPAGNLYGTTVADGLYSLGSAFKVTPSGEYLSFHDFTNGSDGGSPYSNLVLDAHGKLYGTTGFGGAYGKGVVFEITP